MPNSRNQNQNRGSGQGTGDQFRNVGQQAQQAAEQAGERLREGYDSAREVAAYGYQHAEEMVARNPVPSMLIGFGVGLGLGLVLSSMFRREETWAERYLPESIRDLPDRYQGLVSSLKSMPKAVHDHLPGSITRHLG